MAQFILRWDTSKPDQALRRLIDRYPQAVARALNRAGHSANLAVVRVVSADLKLKTSDVEAQTKEVKATPTEHRFVVKASARQIPLIQFRASGVEPSRGRARAVTANVGQGRKTYPGAFIATVGVGRHRGVFARTGALHRRSRGAWSLNLPIRELQGPSIWHVFAKHTDVGLARGSEQLVKNLRSEFRFAMQQTV